MDQVGVQSVVRIICSMKKYPKIGSIHNVTKSNNSYNWEQGCCFCKGMFEEDEEYIRVDVEYTFMRGDDEVFCFHKQCRPANILKEIEKL